MFIFSLPVKTRDCGDTKSTTSSVSGGRMNDAKLWEVRVPTVTSQRGWFPNVNSISANSLETMPNKLRILSLSLTARCVGKWGGDLLIKDHKLIQAEMTEAVFCLQWLFYLQFQLTLIDFAFRSVWTGTSREGCSASTAATANRWWAQRGWSIYFSAILSFLRENAFIMSPCNKEKKWFLFFSFTDFFFLSFSPGWLVGRGGSDVRRRTP